MKNCARDVKKEHPGTLFFAISAKSIRMLLIHSEIAYSHQTVQNTKNSALSGL